VPTITARETQDLDADGKIDALKITFDDEIKDSTVTAANFDVAGYAGEAFSSTTNSDVADNNVIYITFTEGGASDSDAVPNLTYTAGTATDLADNALATNGPTASTDKAKPVITAVREFDMNADGSIDETMLTYSEAISDASITVANFTIGGTTADAKMAATSTNGVDTNAADDATITIKVTAGVSGTEKKAVVYTAGTTADMSVGANVGVTQTFIAGDVTDSAKPIITSATLKDIDTNGKIDRVDTVWSENLTLDATAATSHGFQFSGHGLGATSVTNFTIAGGSNTLNISIPEAGESTDTSVSDFNLIYTAGTNDLTDGTTTVATKTLTSVSTPALADGAVPQIVSSTGLDGDNDGKTNSYTITFSENLTDKGAAALNANFTAKNTTTAGVITVSTVGIGLTAGGGATKVTLNLDDADSDNYTGPITFSYSGALGGDVVEDASSATNDFAAVTDSALTDDVAPVLLSSRGGSNGGTADVLDNAGEIIDLIFSEPMNVTTPSIANLEAGLTFANGAVDGDNNLGGGTNTVTRVTMNLSNDTYRITRGDTDSTSLITPGTDTAQVTLGTNILDTANVTANTNPVAVTISVADITSPTIEAITTLDQDADGQVDAIKVEYSETMNNTVNSTNNFTVAGHTLNSTGTWSTKDFADDVITFAINEIGVDSAELPSVSYTQDGSDDMKDVSSNLLANDLANVPTDGAKPVSVSAMYKDINND
jgi:hypothetical protein